MKTNLIIIRGNSGSGKTTTAKSVQKTLGRGTLLISQDAVRREMLMVRDTEGNLAIDLIQQIAAFGRNQCEHVIVEGILYENYYGEMLKKLSHSFDHTFAYYFDLPFEETVRRHQLRDKKEEFGEESLRAWWRPADYLCLKGEKCLTSNMSNDEILDIILHDLDKK
ncbi:kinase [Gracilibacillus sp. S3-1-1]|uniref:Kinase n=1 Tax=Gracilibacillus pellucidus TaxID=3095368 RepID=A0ACC6M427_9BACI|nr:kinase [Gracilibacillus sp. S3-1-1]MDX8045653.1 kinase [Gracilibacillus sp. S3-1-1]